MTDFQSEIRLAIKAQLQGKADIAAITKSIAELESVITKQAAAAKKGVGSIDDLKDSYSALQRVAEQLDSASGLVSAFQKQQASIEKTSAKLLGYETRLSELNAKVAAAGKATQTQSDQNIKLSASIQNATERLAAQRSALATLDGELRQAGIASNELGVAQERIREAATQTAVALARNRNAQQTFNADLRVAAQAIKEKADAEQRAIAVSNAAAVADKVVADEALRLAAAEKAAADASAAAAARNKSLDSSNNIRNASEAARKGAEYIALWRQELDRADAELEALAKQNVGLNKLADTAQIAGRQFTTLARASTDLAPKIVSIRDAVNAIISPANNARTTLAGVEGEVGKLSKAVESIKGPVTDYREQLRSIELATRSISDQAGLIDNFRQQAAALRSARAEFSATRAQVIQYAASVRQGGESGASFTKALGDAQVKARAAAQALSEQVVATRAARDALRAAGIDSSNLAASEQRLVSSAVQATSATKSLGDAVQKYGTEAERAGKVNPFGSGERTTLGFVQRLRGEVLGLVAAYTGLQGAISLAKGAIDVFNVRQGAKSQLAISVGDDRALVDAEYQYVRDQAERIGVEFEKVVSSYAKFAASARLAGRSQQEVRFIFESVAEIGRVANLTTENLDGVFKALDQIFSKGTIQAEELRGQLGDRLFGAFQVAAQSLKDTFPDLNKALKDGLVSSDQLVKIIARYKEIVAGSLPAAQQSLAAQQMRVNNAVFDFKALIADGGFATAYKEALAEIVVFLKSEDGKKFAQDIADKFSFLAKVLVIVAENAQTIYSILGAIVALKAVGIVAELSTNLVRLAFVSGTAAVALTGVELAVARIQKAFSLLTAFIVTWEIATIAYEKFAWVQIVGDRIVSVFQQALTVLVADWDLALATIPALAKNAFAGFINIVTWNIRSAIGLFADFARVVGATNAADALVAFNNKITMSFEDVGAKAAAIRAQLKKDLAAIRADFNVDRSRRAPVTSDASGIAATAKPEFDKSGKKGPTEAEIAKRKAQIEEITKALESLSAKTDRAQKDTLSAQLAAVDTQYLSLERKIVELGGKEARDFQIKLDQEKYAARVQIIEKFNAEVLKEQEALQNKIEGIEAAGGKKQKDELGTRLDAISKQYLDVYRSIAAERAKLSSNSFSTAEIDALRVRLDLGIKQLQNVETLKFAIEQIRIKEEEVNKTLGERDKLIAAVNAQKEVGKINDVQAADEVNRINSEAAPKVRAAADAAIAWAEANQLAFGSPELQQAFINTLDAIALKAQNVKIQFDAIGQTVVSGGLGAVNQGLDDIFNGLKQVAIGQKSVSQGFRDIAKSALGVFADFLRDIALAIIKLQIFNLMKQSGNPYLIAIGTAGAASVGVKHSGGRVGDVSNRTRVVDPNWYSFAPRYHEGGIPGIAPDEYLSILKKNEEVLTDTSPRNIMNGGAAAGGAQSMPQSNRFVLVDDRTRVPEAMAGADGERVTMMHIKANLPTIKQLIK